jgi:hypothetical protein
MIKVRTLGEVASNFRKMDMYHSASSKINVFLSDVYAKTNDNSKLFLFRETGSMPALSYIMNFV